MRKEITEGLIQQNIGLHGDPNQIEPALIFIADISGFTEFVTQTPILHSKDIISELLEVVIDSNKLDLEISEIEGDAILFYRYGPAPSMEVLESQLNAIYDLFEDAISHYESTRVCCCEACEMTKDLAIKVIVHYGPVTSMVVKHFDKLIGPAVIGIHRLLKNSVGLDQYALLTHDYLKTQRTDESDEFICPPSWKRGMDEYKHLGPTHYCYSDYPFSDRTKATAFKDEDLGDTEVLLTLSINAPMSWVHHVIIDPVLLSSHGEIKIALQDPRKVFRIGNFHSLVSSSTKLDLQTVVNKVDEEIRYAVKLINAELPSYALFELSEQGDNCEMKVSVSNHISEGDKNVLKSFADQIKVVSEKEYNAEHWAAGIF